MQKPDSVVSPGDNRVDSLSRPRQAESGRIKELDGLRAVSVLLVIATHQLGAAHFIDYLPALEQTRIILGGTGVQIFFVISGFIITRLQLNEVRATGKASIGKFYIKRFFRIIPAYWTYLGVITVLWLVGEIQMRGICLLRSVLFISNFKWYPDVEGWFCGHSWSLSVEEQYYIAFSLVMGALWGRRLPWIITALVICYFISTWCIRLSWITHFWILGFFVPYKYIIVGVLMAIAWERLAPLLKNLSIAVPLVMIAFMFLRPALYQHRALNFLLVEPIEAIAIALLVGWVIQNPDACGFLRWRLFQWLGATSYSLYLWQQLFLGTPDLYNHLVLSTPVIGLVLLFLCAAASFYWIEQPCQRRAKSICANLG